MAKLFYGLIGHPLTHSFSPAYFNERFRAEGIDAEYLAFPMEDIGKLPELLREYPQLRGLNVTIPHKTAVLPFLHAQSADVQEMCAANCISIENGKLTGHNTDWTGFRDSLKPLLQPHHKKALVLGGGGAAKAVVYALRQLGIAFEVVSRGRAPWPFRSYTAITPELLGEYTLVINTTPLGMHPAEEAAPDIPYEALTSRHLLYDLIYNPEETVFLKRGREQGAATKNGLEMLHLQADASCRIWQGAHLASGN